MYCRIHCILNLFKDLCGSEMGKKVPPQLETVETTKSANVIAYSRYQKGRGITEFTIASKRMASEIKLQSGDRPKDSPRAFSIDI